MAIGLMCFDARGEVLADGHKSLIEQGTFSIIGHDDEAQTLREFWAAVRGDMGRLNPLIGFNVFNFDLPFLFRRSWKHRIEVPVPSACGVEGYRMTSWLTCATLGSLATAKLAGVWIASRNI